MRIKFFQNEQSLKLALLSVILAFIGQLLLFFATDYISFGRGNFLSSAGIMAIFLSITGIVLTLWSAITTLRNLLFCLRQKPFAQQTQERLILGLSVLTLFIIVFARTG